MKRTVTFRQSSLRAWGMVAIALLALAGYGWSAQPVNQSSAAMAVQPQVLKLSPGLNATVLSARPNTDMVELSNGRRVSLGDIRRLRGVAERLRKPAVVTPVPAAFKIQPAASGKLVRNAVDLATALKRPDAETLQLPSGRRVTVGQVRFVKEQVEKALGRSLTDLPHRPDLSGQAIRVAEVKDWKGVLQKPDSTVLEAPDGTRITLGELKKSFAGRKGQQRPGLPPVSRPGRAE